MAILQAHPRGIKEFDLIKELERRGFKEFAPVGASDLELFRTHFFLFHILYRLKDLLRERREGDLSIHCLEIRRLPFSETRDNHQPAAVDPLRAYYMDLKNLDKTDEQAVADMLNAFWCRFFRQDERKSALAVLELEEGADLSAIKKRFRQLVRKHHPDHGGKAEKFREIRQAMETLTLWSGSRV